MGWLWSPSKPDSASEQPSSAPQQQTTSYLPSPGEGHDGRDQREEQEIKEFWRQLNDSDTSSSTAGAAGAETADAESHNLYPTEMSCRSAFDYAFFCQSFGGQWVNIYRYGTLRSCSEHWSDFWFCMRTNSLPEAERKAAIQDRYRRKAIKYKTGPSSEDVWEARTEPVKGAFQGDFLAFEKRVKELEEQEKRAANHGNPDPGQASTTM